MSSAPGQVDYSILIRALSADFHKYGGIRRRCIPGVIAQLPHASRIAALEPAQQYAAAELFRGAMMSHSVIVRRDDCPGRSQGISFAGDAWLDYVPVRVPDTLCVQERLPPGLRRS
jgi:hypothetical protein